MVTNSFTMQGSTIDTDAAQGGVATGQLKLSGTAVFNWNAGAIKRTEITLGSPTNRTVSATIDGTNGNVTLNSSSVTNFGTSFAAKGTIFVTSGLSFIYNEAGATFEAKDGFSFRDTILRDVGAVYNDGTFKFTNATGRIDADFSNDGGLVRVTGGTAHFTVTAVQSSGTFDLDNGNVKMGTVAGHAPLTISGGEIIGQGTIDGNLALGYDDGGAKASNATINPGWTTPIPSLPVYTPGTLTVTEAFQMFSAGNMVRIDITPAGNKDKVVVTGYAALTGTLSVNPSKDYKPAAGTKAIFVTASEFKGDFGTKTLTYTGTWFHAANPNRGHYWEIQPKAATEYFMVVKLEPGTPPP